MGITIHYTLITDDFETVLMAVKTVRESAGRKGYRVEEVSGDVYVCYSKFAMRMDMNRPENTMEYLKKRWGGYREQVLEEVPDEPPWPWIITDYPEMGWYCYATPYTPYTRSRGEKRSRLEGVVVQIDTAEPFTMAFYQIGRYYVCDGFTKTQAFTVDEVEPNTEYHKWICHVLKYLEKNGRWWSFYLFDEAEYYDTMDDSRIADSFQTLNKMIYGFATELDKAVEELGLGESVTVGGGINIREARKKIGEIYREDYESGGVPSKKPHQSRLDEFMNNRGGGDE